MARLHAAIRFRAASKNAISVELKYRISASPAAKPPPDHPTASHRYTELVAEAVQALSPATMLPAVNKAPQRMHSGPSVQNEVSSMAPGPNTSPRSEERRV